METNLERAKRQLKDHAAISGIELPDNGFIMQMLELAATTKCECYTLKDMEKAYQAGVVANAPEIWVAKWKDIPTGRKIELSDIFSDFIKSMI